MDPLFERDQKGFPCEEVPPRPGVFERPDRKAVSKGMNREGELLKRGWMGRESRRQGGDACVCVRVRQMYSELRGRASHWDNWYWGCILNGNMRREDKLDQSMKPFRNLAGE